MAREQTGAAGRRKANGSAASPRQAGAGGKDELLKYYRDMLLIRRFEERAGQLYGMGLIGGFCHLYIGQEAIAVGVQAVHKPGDQVITGYREHGHMLACGMDPKRGDGRADRPRLRLVQGQGRLDAHVLDQADFYGGHGIVGAQVPLGTGLALANRYRDDEGVVHLLRRRRGHVFSDQARRMFQRHLTFACC